MNATTKNAIVFVADAAKVSTELFSVVKPFARTAGEYFNPKTHKYQAGFQSQVTLRFKAKDYSEEQDWEGWQDTLRITRVIGTSLKALGYKDTTLNIDYGVYEDYKTTISLTPNKQVTVQSAVVDGGRYIQVHIQETEF